MGGSTLYLARHGMTDSNIPGLLRDSDDDTVNEVGKEQSRNIGLHFKAENIYPVIITSPIHRAQQTAEIIQSILGDVPVYTDEDVRSWNYGDLEYTADLAPYQKDWDLVPPGGEPYRVFSERVKKAMGKYIFAPLPNLIVTHSRFLYLLKFLAGDSDVIATNGPPDPGSISKLKIKFKSELDTEDD